MTREHYYIKDLFSRNIARKRTKIIFYSGGLYIDDNGGEGVFLMKHR